MHFVKLLLALVLLVAATAKAQNVLLRCTSDPQDYNRLQEAPGSMPSDVGIHFPLNLKDRGNVVAHSDLAPVDGVSAPQYRP